MSAMSPWASPTTERHTIPATSRILYGLTYRNSRPNSSRCVNEALDPYYFCGLHASLETFSVKAKPAPEGTTTGAPTLVRYESPARLSSRRAGAICSLFIQFAVHDLGSVTPAVPRLVHGFRQHDRTMPPPGAAKCNRQVALPLADIVGDQISQQSFGAPQELPSLRKGADIAGHARVAPGELAQPRHETRIRQKAHVENEACAGWAAPLLAKTHPATHHPPPLPLSNLPASNLPHLV